MQINPEGTDLLQTRLGERDEAENEPLLDGDNDDSDKEDNGGSESSSDEKNENDCIDSGDRDKSSVILAFIDEAKKLRGQPQHVREES